MNDLHDLIAEGIKELQNDSALSILGHSLVKAIHVRAMPDPPLTGSIRGAGVHTAGETIRLQAYPKTGYHFVKWTMEGETVGDSTLIELTDTANTSIIAHFEVTPASALQNTDLQDDLQIYPNPARDQIVIKSPVRIDSVEFIDLTGRMFYQVPCDKLYISIDLNANILPVFLVKVYTENGIIVKKTERGRQTESSY